MPNRFLKPEEAIVYTTKGFLSSVANSNATPQEVVYVLVGYLQSNKEQAEKLYHKYAELAQEVATASHIIHDWHNPPWEDMPMTWDKLSGPAKQILITMYDEYHKASNNEQKPS